MLNYNLKDIPSWPLPMRILIIGLMCLVVIYFGYFLDISNLTTKLSNIKKEEQTLKDQFNGLFAQQYQLEMDISELPALKSALNTWQKKLVNPTEIPELLNEILKIGTANQLQFNLFNPGAEVKEEDYIKVPIRVEIVGGYNQIASFISQVANMPWIVVIGDFTISEGSKNAKEPTVGGVNSLVAELTMEVYYFGKK